MIKLSVMAREAPDRSIEDMVRFAKSELDIDTIDLHLSGFNRDPEYLMRLKILCLKLGLPLGYLGIPSGFPKLDDQSQKEAMDSHKADVDLASFMGAPLVRVFARGCPVPEDRDEYERLFASAIQSYQELSDYAAEKGIIVALQNHNHGSWANTADVCLRIIRETSRENFSYIMDTGQWLGAVGGSPRGWHDTGVDLYEDYLARVAPFACYVRAKIYKMDSGHESWLDYRKILRILQDVDYNGTIGVVLEHQPAEFDEYEALRRATKHLRTVVAESYAERDMA